MDQTDHQQLNSLEFRDPFYRLEPSRSPTKCRTVIISVSGPPHPGAEHVWERREGGREGGKMEGCKQVQVNKLQDNVGLVVWLGRQGWTRDNLTRQINQPQHVVSNLVARMLSNCKTVLIREQRDHFQDGRTRGTMTCWTSTTL